MKTSRRAACGCLLRSVTPLPLGSKVVCAQHRHTVIVPEPGLGWAVYAVVTLLIVASFLLGAVAC